MPTNVIMPALEMAQDTGKLIAWRKREGEAVSKGEPLMEIETDKVTVEIEAPATGTLSAVRAHAGDVVPVGQTIALILAPGEKGPTAPAAKAPAAPLDVTPLARRVAEEHGVDLASVKAIGPRIEKSDVLTFVESQKFPTATAPVASSDGAQLLPASPKARRLAVERGVDIAAVVGSGPGDAVLAADVPALPPAVAVQPQATPADAPLSTVWRIMAERMSASWTQAPHFYLTREVLASGLIDLRARIAPAVEKRSGVKPTYTDLLVKLVASALRNHPRLHASWTGNTVRANAEINVGIATAVEDGLVVPVIRHADRLTIGEIAAQRQQLVERANGRKLRPADIADGTFTLSNLGMYGVDAFNAIVNPPQAAILAVGRIAERVVPVNGQPAVRPVMVLTLSCDHRVVDGARGAQFLDALAALIEEPWGLLA
ncbi:MAG: 2-oxo acid dehydrogenase subunit E2 [Chloroflexi bacterium]|nr:2-oxo acid dehydrogenase subunit E2 [Chloroflexota bacterium]